MKEYRFSLDNSRPNRLFPCPSCKQRTFKKFWDKLKNEYFPDEDVGRCDSEISCGYFQSPKAFYQKHGIDYNKIERNYIYQPKPKPPTTYIDESWVKKSMNRPIPNYFIDYLGRLFGKEQSNILVNQFRIGGSKRWKGATVFWHIDQDFKVRSGKIMLYNSKIGKRIKFCDNWVHSVAEIKDFTLGLCFFGLHQLTENSSKTIGIVESQKSAIILTGINSKMLWLASGGLNGLQIERFEPLKGRKIILYPDAGIDKNGTPFQKWSKRADELIQLGFNVSVSKLVENAATDEQRIKGYDLADYYTLIDKNGQSVLNQKSINT